MGFGLEIRGPDFKGVGKRAREALVAEVSRQSSLLAEHIRRRHLSGPTSANSLKSRSGRLRGSTVPAPVSNDGGIIRGGVKINVPYAGVHVGPRGKETVIRPRRSRYLAIPLGAERRRPREIPGLFPVRSRKGNLLLAQKSGEKGIKPLFVLKKSVVIKTRIHPDEILERRAASIHRGLTRAVRETL